MRVNLVRFVLAVSAAACLMTGARAAILVGPGGAGPLTFDSAPTGTDFLTAYFGGDGTTYATTQDIDADVQTIPAAAFQANFVLAQSATQPPSPYAYGFRYNTAGLFLQSRATTVSGAATNPGSAAVVMLGTFQNDTGADQPVITLSYNMTTNTPAVGELPGHRVYFSVGGAAGTWQLIPELSGIETNGLLSAALNLGAWPNGGLLYIFWFDDNANTVSDTSYALDNLAIQIGSGPEVPAEITDDSALTNRTVPELASLTLSITAVGNPISYQWFHDATPLENSTNCNNGNRRVISGARSATLRIDGVETTDAGFYYCAVSNALNEANSVAAEITITPDTVAPRIMFASLGANPSEIVLQLSEPLNDSCLDVGTGGAVSDLSTWVVEELVPGAGPQQLGVDSFTNTPSMTGARVIGLRTFLSPSDPSNPIRITTQTELYDTSAAQNILPANTVIFVANSSNELVSLNAVWRYNDQDVDPGPNWFQPSFDASSFPQGPGPFDAKRDQPAPGGHCRPTALHGLGDVGTCINLTSPVTGTNLITANFWTRFNFNGDPATSLLRLNGKADDGAVIYLNGQELQRIRLPAAPAPITRTTFANAAVNDPDPQDVFDYLSPASLAQGENVLAVELHQASLTSSDYTLGLHVYAFTAPLPRLTITHNAGNVTLTWSPELGELQYTDSLEPADWNPIANATSGYSEPANQPGRFYRVALP